MVEQTSVLDRTDEAASASALPFGLLCEERYVSVPGSNDLVWRSPTGEYVTVTNATTSYQTFGNNTVDFGATSGFWIFTDQDVAFD
jgi:hypothetical protein